MATKRVTTRARGVLKPNKKGIGISPKVSVDGKVTGWRVFDADRMITIRTFPPNRKIEAQRFRTAQSQEVRLGSRSRKLSRKKSKR